MQNINFLSATQLSAAIQAKEISVVEVVECFLEQIASHNPAINAIITLDSENALQRAREADQALARGEIWGALHGVPITFKDVFATAGLRTTSGFKPLENYIPQQDALVVARMRAAGAIVLGKTNTPELANDEQTNNRIFGRTNNPWNVERTSGGSSGGSAAAIAAGFSALDIGSDIGGSVRNPAAFCGTFSMKPTDGLVPFAGHIPPFPNIKGRGLMRYFLTPGPLARSVEDLRLALKIIAGPHAQQWEVPPVHLSEPVKRSLPQLRIAWTDDFGVPVSQDIRLALSGLVEKLSEAGCKVEKITPENFDFNHAIQTYGELKEAAVSVRESPLHLPRFFWRAVSALQPESNPTTRGLLKGAGERFLDYAQALSRRDMYIAQMEGFLSNWDAWLCPVASVTAYPHLPSLNLLDQLRGTVDVDGQKIPYILATSMFTSLFNLTGNPVVVLPFARSAEGLPIGVQVISRRWKDMELLDVADALTQITGPFQVPPAMAV